MQSFSSGTPAAVIQYSDSRKEDIMTKYSPAQKRAVDKYRKNKIERIEITVPAGRKAAYQEAATAAGISLNAFIIECIESALNASELPQEGPQA